MVLNELLLDCGNTSIKYSYLDQTGSFDSLRELTGFLKLYRPANVFVSDVSGKYQEVSRACKNNQIAVHKVTVKNGLLDLQLVYEDITKLGVDRWLAMLGAFKNEAGKELIVVDVGTAVKIDLIDVSGRHIGGSISPGIRIGARSLNQHTAQLPEVSLETSGRLGTDTKTCIQYGVIMGVVALIKYTMLKFGSDARLLVTGGDAKIITPFLDCDFIYKPNLVLEGLRVYRQCQV